MGYPAVDSIMEMVRKINEIGRRARSGEPTADDYLRAVSEEPRTEWFTALLREKNDELVKERERADRLAAALRTWHRASGESATEADVQLVKTLRGMGILERDVI